MNAGAASGWLQSWQLWAILSAVFAALTAIFAKVGVENVNSATRRKSRRSTSLVSCWSPSSVWCFSASGFRW
jgi:uncharacterized membrane protein